MTLSGSYNFNPAFGDALLSAYARIGFRRPQLTAEHFIDAGREGNYALSKFSNLQPLLWTSQLLTVNLIQGTATYTLPIQTVMILDIYIETSQGSITTDRILGPVSTTEYDSFPDKVTQGPPTVYWFDRQITPQVTFWQPPDNGGPYVAKIRTVRQPQDAVLPSGVNMDLPYRFLDAYVDELAWRLARIHAPQMEQQRKANALESWQIAATQDVENVPTFIIPQLGGYYRP